MSVLTASTACGKEISAEKIKLMTNTSGINTEVKVNGQKRETVTSFKFLGSVITDEGSKPEILSWIAQATAGLTRRTKMMVGQSLNMVGQMWGDISADVVGKSSGMKM